MERSNRRYAAIALAGLTVLAAWSVRACITRSGMSGYGHWRGASQEYPWREVLAWSGVITAEAVLAALWLWRTQQPRTASIALGALAAGGVVVLAQLGMHAPAYFGAHVGFLLVAGAWLLATGMIGGLIHWLGGLGSAKHGAHGEAGPPPVPAAVAISHEPPSPR